MGLKDIKLPEAQVEVSPDSGSFAVRGLCLDDIAWLVQRHGDKLQGLFTRFLKEQANQDLTIESVASFMLPLIETAPEIAAEVVACAAGNPRDQDELDVARRLPIPVQLDALSKIVHLTFSTSGGPKKFVETVIGMAQGTTALLSDLRT